MIPSLGRLSLRARLLLLGTLGLAAGLAAGGIALVAVLQSALERSVDEASAQTAAGVVLLVEEGRLPDPVPAGGTTIVQVVDANGDVSAASAGGDRLVPLLRPDELDRGLVEDLGYLPGDRFAVDGVVRVAVAAADDGSRVVVAAPAGDIAETVRVVRTSLLVGYAVLVVVLAAVAWRVVGATLAPVEALRRGAEEITGAGATGTLPVPAGGDEIHALAVTLNDMLARLESGRRRQRAFVADAAHELRSPLTSLRTQLEVGDAEPEDLLAEVHRLADLVDDLLLLARLDEVAPARREPVPLLDLARSVAARHATARVPVAVHGAPATVTADPAAVDRVLANLVDNAVRHAASAVRLAVRPTADGVLLSVTDDGPGIPAAERERVFDRFTRLADARDRDSGGSGLGLAIVRELVAQQGGTVTLSDAADTGLHVQVTFAREDPR